MTGCLQTHARKYSVPIDELKVDFTVGQVFLDQENIERIHKEGGKEDEKAYLGLTTPTDGVLVHGLFLDAGSFNTQTGLLSEPKPGEINPPLPVMQLIPVTKIDTSRLRYYTPMYKTSVSTTGHSTNYVITVLLPTALLTQITD